MVSVGLHTVYAFYHVVHHFAIYRHPCRDTCIIFTPLAVEFLFVALEISEYDYLTG